MLTATALEWDPAGGYWRSTLTITNIGSVPIELPVQLVLRDLPPEIVLNRTGTVQASGGEGAWPYFLLGAPTGSLAPGGTMSVEARFSTSNAVIQWFALSGKLY